MKLKNKFQDEDFEEGEVVDVTMETGRDGSIRPLKLVFGDNQ